MNPKLAMWLDQVPKRPENTVCHVHAIIGGQARLTLADMRADRGGADVEHGYDLFVLADLHDQADHVGLPWRKLRA